MNGEEKANLYKEAHIFCLPTYYPFEGQPFVIIESYAAGCFVITTEHSGIPYIFKDMVNGVKVEKKSVDDLVKIMRKVLEEKYDMYNIGINNYQLAKEQYTSNIYLDKVERVFNKVFDK